MIDILENIMSDDKVGRGRPREYKIEYPDELILKMADGLFDYEIYADWDISKDTFYRWLREYPDLKDAYDIGMAKNLKWWTTIGKERCMGLEDKGFKYWISIMNNKHHWGQDEARRAITHNTQINFNQTQIINNQEDYQKLLENVREQAIDLNVIDILPIELQHDKLGSNEE